MKRPVPGRVLWITADHMRFDCIAAHGNPRIHTPNLDALAAGGVDFTQCHAQNPVCMPSRASFMTGLYPQQTGVTENGFCLRPDFEPIASRCFKAAGYQTSQIGKLHLQPHEDFDLDAHPTHTYGFDFFRLSEERGAYHDAWRTWLEEVHPEHAAKFRTARTTDPARTEKRGVVLEAPWQATQCAWIVQAACTHLKSPYVNRLGRRQFMHLGFHHPHPPLNPTAAAFAPYDGAEIAPPRLARNEADDKPPPLASLLNSRRDWTQQDFIEYRRYFYAMVTELDLAVGMLLDFLRRHNALEDTLLVFTSDHGDMCGDHSLTHKAPHFYEEVMHVPLILHWPAGLGRAGRRVDELVELVDLLPTTLELAGGTPPVTLAGRSHAGPLWDGQPVAGRDDVYAYNGPGMAMVRTAVAKYIHYAPGNHEVLYDLRTDPHEQINRAADPAAARLLDQMRCRMIERTLLASQSPHERLRPF
jgi:arylsulfatase